MSTKFAVTTAVQIDSDKIAELLCSAFEGGSGYWSEIGGYNVPKEVWLWGDGSNIFKYIQYPLSKGGAVIVLETGDGDVSKEHVLDLAAIKRGLQTMANKEPRHFANFLAGNGDADTGDVFLQCCLLGEVVYG